MKRAITNTLILLLILVIVVTSYLLYKEVKVILDNRSEISSVKEEVIVEEISVEMDKVDYFDRKVDFKELKEINEDIVGWIYIPETSVDYPILIGHSDAYYLDKNIYGKYTVLGSIFSLADTSKKLDDARTLLYGHNMAYNEMFGELKKYYQDNEFRKEHDIFYIYTEERVMECRIFSIFSVNENDDIISSSKDFDDNYKEVVSKLYNKNEYSDIDWIDDIDNYNDRQTFTLVTCKGQVGTDIRLLVNGVVVREKEVE